MELGILLLGQLKAEVSLKSLQRFRQTFGIFREVFFLEKSGMDLEDKLNGVIIANFQLVGIAWTLGLSGFPGRGGESEVIGQGDGNLRGYFYGLLDLRR